MKKIKKIQLNFDKEIIVPLSVKELSSINGGQVVKNTKVTCGLTFADCIPDTQQANCRSEICIHFTEGCVTPPLPASLACTGNGCISEQGTCVTCGPNLCLNTFDNNCVRPVISIMNC